MKKQRYIVEIEMPDRDFISAGWLKDLIQTDCDVEDESRKKVTVQENSLPSNLDEAANEKVDELIADMKINGDMIYLPTARVLMIALARFGAEWMAGQGATVDGVLKAGDPGYPDVRMGEQYSIEYILRKPDGIEPGDEVIVQIRKKQ